MVLELAVAGRCEAIITYNKRDFPSPELRRFGLEALTPKEFLTKIGVLR
jgi:predicted nucleic acid-binding protein